MMLKLKYLIGRNVKKFFFMMKKLFSCGGIKGGANSNIELRVHLLAENEGKIIFGNKVSICNGSYLSSIDNGKIVIEDRVYINRCFTAVSRGGIVIKEGTSIGPYVCIYDHDHYFGRKKNKPGYNTGNIVIGKNCWIGNNVSILKNTTIGDNCVIGAGCVISGNIPPNSLVRLQGQIVIEEIKET